MPPKILFLDIETAPAIVYTWGLHDVNIGIEQIIKPSRIICWSAKWFGAKQILYRDERSGTKTMLREMRELLCQAHAVVTYNGDGFDLQKLSGEFVFHRIPPAPPVASIDLFKTVKGLGYISGKLAFIGPYLKIGEKVRHEGFPLWKACLDGDDAAWARMRDYNMQDTELLEGLYTLLRPYIRNHPYLGEGGLECPACQSRRGESRGTRRTRNYIVQRIQCRDCGSWYSGRKQNYLSAA